MPHFLDVTSADIENLTDADLRTLVVRLASAELAAQGLPASSVTAGGHQDAPDGGIDVRVDCPRPLSRPDFVPRTLTGFQVKRPDMAPAAIRKEMRKDGKLRESIQDLVEHKGAYIIVSAQGSVSDEPLRVRRKAIRDAIADAPGADDVAVDFYDRERLAAWANGYPGVASWVRDRVGRGLQGWAALGEWAEASINPSLPFLAGDDACLIDESVSPRQTLTVMEGIARLRKKLAVPRESVRLVGLSGMGKTRLVQALFEPRGEDDPLDPALVVYTDYSCEPSPTARDMAQALVSGRTRAILIVDNCNPATHAVLTKVCRTEGSQVSLLTVEYDVGADEPEHTDVFRLGAAAHRLVADWLGAAYPNVSQRDAATIAAFADGNFRVAAALAGTVQRGETLGQIKSTELFSRLFLQRNDADKDLRFAAASLALLYSIDGEDESATGELAIIGRFRNVDTGELYRALQTLRKRGIVQARGQWRAILPMALANPLAAEALDETPPAAILAFVSSLPPRMQKSFSRRIGYLHDSVEARDLVAKWLAPGGRFDNLAALNEEDLELLTHLAPVHPEAVMSSIATALDDNAIAAITDAHLRYRWAQLIHALAYDDHTFDGAAATLARMVLTDNAHHNHHSTKDLFAVLFRMQISGTHASPERRRVFVHRLASDARMSRPANLALDAMLNIFGGQSLPSSSFGARPRDWGWQPDSREAFVAWMDEALNLVIEFADGPVAGRALLAKHLASLWRIEPWRPALDQTARALATVNGWTDGWLAVRHALYLARLRKEVIDDRLVSLERALAPTTLVDRARAVVATARRGAADYEDGEDCDDDLDSHVSKADMASRRIGRELAKDATARSVFLPDLMIAKGPSRAFQCGLGLADGTPDMTGLWQELIDLARDRQYQVQADVLCGVLSRWHATDSGAAIAAIEALGSEPDAAPLLPAFEWVVGLDANGVTRLVRAIDAGFLPPHNLCHLGAAAVAKTPADSLARLIDTLAMKGGEPAALDVLHGRLWNERREERQSDALIIEAGQRLLPRIDFASDAIDEYLLGHVIDDCCAGPDGTPVARSVCQALATLFDSFTKRPDDFAHALPALLRTQPFAALTSLLLRNGSPRSPHIWRPDRDFGPALHDVPADTLIRWAEEDSPARFGALSSEMTLFAHRPTDETGALSTTFLKVLEAAPDKAAFLGDFISRLMPGLWSGSLASVLEDRTAALRRLSPCPPGITAWLDANKADLAAYVAQERQYDRASEQSFE